MTDEVQAQLRAAAESIDAAELLLERGHYGFSAARSYYTMFYCASALHAHQGRSYSRHGGVIAGFGQHFVKTALFDPKFHTYLRDAFRDRQRGDYGMMDFVSQETARAVLAHSREFLDATRAFLGA